MEEQPERLSGPSDAAGRLKEIAQATGLLMGQFGLKIGDARDELETVAHEQDRAVCDVARDIVESGGL